MIIKKYDDKKNLFDKYILSKKWFEILTCGFIKNYLNHVLFFRKNISKIIK